MRRSSLEKVRILLFDHGFVSCGVDGDAVEQFILKYSNDKFSCNIRVYVYFEAPLEVDIRGEYWERSKIFPVRFTILGITGLNDFKRIVKINILPVYQKLKKYRTHTPIQYQMSIDLHR